MAEKQCTECGHFVYEHDSKGRCWCDRKIHKSALEVKDQHDPNERKARQDHITKELGY